MLSGVKIGLFVTGGIAAYKVAQLARLYIQAGAEVRVAMTTSAQAFITPLTFQTLTKHHVLVDTFDEHDPTVVQHIQMADWLDIAVVAPATANIIAKLANGIADEIVSTTLLAVDKPCLVVPAMNTRMYTHPATQRNIERVSSYPQYHVLEPETGFLAEGYEGKGRLPEPLAILESTVKTYQSSVTSDMLFGKHVLITAGGTRERIDPVRYISNDSSGKMGYAMAEVARDLGAKVTLISTKPNMVEPHGIVIEYVDSALEMLERIQNIQVQNMPDYIVMAAAVSDYRVAHPAAEKLKKQDREEDAWMLELTENPDILATLTAATINQPNRPIYVGFAAETQRVIEYAQAKLKRKQVDWIVANDVSQPDIGFNSDENAVHLIGKDGTVQSISQRSKRDIAEAVWDEIIGEAEKNNCHSEKG